MSPDGPRATTAGAAPRIEPYRLLFPLGVAAGMAGALLWTLNAPGWIPYPALSHPLLMLQGFEICFVIGFLLTAMSGLLHAEPCHPLELALALLFTLAIPIAVLAGSIAAAEAGFALALLLVLAVAARRAGGRRAPPLEMLFVLLGLLMGLAGSAYLFAGALGIAAEPVPRFGLRLVSLGMMLTVVLGVGGLLVPTFLGVPRPLEISAVAGPHARGGRLRLYLTVAALLVLAFVLEALRHPGLGAWTRAGAATPMLLRVWKLPARPARSDRFAFALRSAGLAVLAGLWLAALLPPQGVAAYHLVFIGGFGLLTLGIGTRVVAAHGGRGLAGEQRLLTRAPVTALLLALAARLLASWLPRFAAPLLGASGALWAVAWAVWLWRAAPMLVRARTPAAAAPTAVRIETPR